MAVRLDVLKTRFLARSAERARDLDRVLFDLNSGRLDAVAAIERIAHRLAGSAGSFGFPEISASAEAAERAAMALLSGRADDVARVRSATEALRNELARSVVAAAANRAAPAAQGARP